MPTGFILDTDGKVVTGQSTTAHIVNLAIMHKGWHKFYPFIGAGIEENLDDKLNLETINRDIAEEVRKDGGQLEFDYSNPDNIKWYGSY